MLRNAVGFGGSGLHIPGCQRYQHADSRVLKRRLVQLANLVVDTAQTADDWTC